ncbi:MAG: DUF4435 domain-containing protein [Prevotellaceae bacterium]|nr:DUF4435 domain-containing protein [Prevotellaceae bacterium]
MEKNRSLINQIDAQSKIVEELLTLKNDVGNSLVLILVEGEDDCRIYPKFFKQDSTRVEFIPGGKCQLINVLSALTAITNQVIGISDADFLHLEKNYPDVTNLFYTDYHDIEMTMLSFDPVHDNLFAEYRMLDKRSEIWQNIMQQSSYLAYIRWYNEKNNCQINFSGLKYGDKLTEISKGKISFKNQALLQTLNIRSKDKTEELTETNINDFITDNKTADGLNLCNGHDTIALLALIVGSLVSYKELCRHLRLSFTIKEFLQTKLYLQLSDWQTRNGYNILKNAV